MWCTTQVRHVLDVLLIPTASHSRVISHFRFQLYFLFCSVTHNLLDNVWMGFLPVSLLAELFRLQQLDVPAGRFAMGGVVRVLQKKLQT